MSQAGISRGNNPVTGTVKGLAVAAVSIALITSCGGSSSPSAPSTPAPTPTPAPIKTLLKQGSTSDLQAHYVQYIPFSIGNTGRIDATVDWTFSTDRVVVVVASGIHTCFDGTYINFTVCNVITQQRDASKPKKVSAPGQPSGSYTLYIDNLGPATESVSWQVFVTNPG